MLYNDTNVYIQRVASPRLSSLTAEHMQCILVRPEKIRISSLNCSVLVLLAAQHCNTATYYARLCVSVHLPSRHRPSRIPTNCAPSRRTSVASREIDKSQTNATHFSAEKNSNATWDSLGSEFAQISNINTDIRHAL